jgi:hypothetical protein
VLRAREETMIEQVVEFSVAAGAAAVNVVTPNFNPIPVDGYFRVLGVTDPPSTGGSGAYTALPSVQVQIGGSPPTTPCPQSTIPTPAAVADAFSPPRAVLMGWTPVRMASNIQVLLIGTNVAAAAAGRFKFQLATAAELASQLPLPEAA